MSSEQLTGSLLSSRRLLHAAIRAQLYVWDVLLFCSKTGGKKVAGSFKVGNGLPFTQSEEHNIYNLTQ